MRIVLFTFLLISFVSRPALAKTSPCKGVNAEAATCMAKNKEWLRLSQTLYRPSLIPAFRDSRWVTSILRYLPKKSEVLFIDFYKKALAKNNKTKLAPLVAELNYRLGLANYDLKKYRLAEAHLRKVTVDPYKSRAKIVLASILIEKKRIALAKNLLISLVADLEEKRKKLALSGNTETFYGAVIMLSRIYMAEGDINNAKTTLTRVKKPSFDLYHAFVDLGWAQINQKEYTNPIGNMFFISKQLPKDAYLPGLYQVWSISYLKICQYAQARSVAQGFEKKYKHLWNQIKNQALPKKATAFKDYLFHAHKRGTGPYRHWPTKYIDSLFVDQSFINLQSLVNNLEDEYVYINSMSPNQKQPLLKAYRYWKSLFEKRAGQALLRRHGQFKKALAESFRQKDLILLQVYAKAGMTLRYKNAGATQEENSIEVPHTAKQYRWDFNKELWEDEKGNFYAQTKNLCDLKRSKISQR